MRDELDGLARRFRAAIEAETAAQRRREAEETARLAAADAARTALLDDLTAFGQAVGLQVHTTASEGADADAVELTRGARRVVVTPTGPGDHLRIAWQDARGGEREARAYREPKLDDLWVFAPGGGGPRVPLVEQGWVRVLTEGLGLPVPEAPEPTPRTADEGRDL